jgi:hypothetical protein
MVEYWKRDQDSKIPLAFLHVPEGVDNEHIARGNRVTLSLIQAVVDKYVAK